MKDIIPKVVLGSKGGGEKQSQESKDHVIPFMFVIQDHTYYVHKSFDIIQSMSYSYLWLVLNEILVDLTKYLYLISIIFESESIISWETTNLDVISNQ